MYHYKWRQFEKDTKKIVKRIEKAGLNFKGVYGIPRGGLPLATKLSHLLDIQLVLNKKEICANILIVDDISDTGKTLSKFKYHNFIVTLFYHKLTTTMPNIYVREKKNDWISFPWEV